MKLCIYKGPSNLLSHDAYTKPLAIAAPVSAPGKAFGKAEPTHPPNTPTQPAAPRATSYPHP